MEKDARFKINELLKQADWRLFDTPLSKANVLEEKTIAFNPKSNKRAVLTSERHRIETPQPSSPGAVIE
jgi:hypothetical protein